MHDVDRFFHQPLRAGDVAVQPLGVDRRLLLQGGQPDVDARQRLGDDIMQFAADVFALLLLRRENLAGQPPQLLLQPVRLFQQLRIMVFAFLERRLRRLALGDLQAQFQVRGGQFHRALAQRLDEFFQLDGGLPRAAMRLLDRGDRHGKENPRLLDERARRAAGQPGNTSATRICSCSLARSSVCSPAASAWPPSPRADSRLACRPCFRWARQRRPIAAGKIEEFAFHGFPILRPACRTDRADFTTSRWVLAISFLSPAVLLRASCFKVSRRTLMPSSVWAISSLQLAADLHAFFLLRLQHLMRQLPQTLL